MTEVATALAPPPPETTAEAPKRKAKSASVIVACKLPNGIRLEIGIQTVERNADGKMVTSVKRLSNYASVDLKGWNSHNTTGLQMPHGYQQQPYLNRNVPRAFWEQWCKDHPNSWLLKREILVGLDDEASAQLEVINGAKANTPKPFAPLIADPKKNEVRTAEGEKIAGIETFKQD